MSKLAILFKFVAIYAKAL